MQGYFGAPTHLKKSSSPAHEQSPSATGQARVDAIQADFRADQVAPSPFRREPPPRKSIRREAPPLPAALVPTDDVLKLRLAEELEYARRTLDLLADELSADMGVLMRHGVAMQSFDIVGQILGHIANVVRSSDPDGAVNRIGMCELKARLTRTKID